MDMERQKKSGKNICKLDSLALEKGHFYCQSTKGKDARLCDCKPRLIARRIVILLS